MTRIDIRTLLKDWPGHGVQDYIASTVANQATVNAPVVPDDTVRLVMNASMGEANVSAASERFIWLERVNADGNITTAVSTAFHIPAGVATAIAHGTQTPFVMLPGEKLRGRREPASGPGEDLRLRQVVIDFPLRTNPITSN